jgi:hypothetical protein
MAHNVIRGRVFIGAVAAAAAAVAAGGVALASTPDSTRAAVAPHVYIASHNAAIGVPFSNFATIGHLKLPAGAFTVTAKAWMTSVAGLGNSAIVCKLTLGTNSDQVQGDAQDSTISTQPVRNEVLYLTISGGIAKPAQALLICKNAGGGNTDLKFTKITAMKVSGVTKTTF